MLYTLHSTWFKKRKRLELWVRDCVVECGRTLGDTIEGVGR